ncbi:hypothetical protein RQP46_006664 [Phenoliferia psychrophenolica]
MSQTKVHIANSAGPAIVGILQRARPQEPTAGRPLVLIVHGVLAHKDQLYHKRLANELATERGMDSFRYDMRGQGGETEGFWEQGNFDDDADDLESVIAYLSSTYGYHVHTLIGHSRGSIVTGLFLSTRAHRPIRFWINVSGRYDHANYLQSYTHVAAFAKDGHFDWNVMVAGKMITRRLTPKSVTDFAEWDNSYLIKSFPQEMDCLTMHGEADTVVPVEAGWSHHKILSQRTGSHTLKIVPGAGHNWVRPFDEPVNGIMEWLGKVDPMPAGGRVSKL